jgi:hypothetical protein
MTSRPSSSARPSMARPPHSVSADRGIDGIADVDTLMPAFARLVDDTLAQVEACPPKPDTTFDGYEGLLAAVRSATTLEGMLLERGIALVAALNPDLVLVPLERPLPVHEAAKAVFRRNDWSKASGLRLDSEVVAREFYKPDLLIVDGTLQLALILDVKRSVASYKPRTLAELRSRMMASALVVRDVLERDHDAPPVARADIAIIDGAGDCRDEARGIFALDDLDWMLRIEGAAAAITRLRELYGRKVRAVLDERCRAIVMPRQNGRHSHGRFGERSNDPANGDGCGHDEGMTDGVLDPSNEGAAPAALDDRVGDEADEERPGSASLATADERLTGVPARRLVPRVQVGIASRRAH